jgi:hypothetical protein
MDAGGEVFRDYNLKSMAHLVDVLARSPYPAYW